MDSMRGVGGTRKDAALREGVVPAPEQRGRAVPTPGVPKPVEYEMPTLGVPLQARAEQPAVPPAAVATEPAAAPATEPAVEPATEPAAEPAVEPAVAARVLETPASIPVRVVLAEERTADSWDALPSTGYQPEPEFTRERNPEPTRIG